MSRRISTIISENIPTELLYFKAEFNKVLNQRIILGEELYNRPIHTLAGLKKNKEEFITWNAFNSDYLGKAFNREHNEYKKCYDESISSFFSSFTIRNSPVQDQKDFKDKINNKINNLKKIRSKIDEMRTGVLKSAVFRKNEVETYKTEIFIVPGNDEIVLNKTLSFVQSLGLKAIILNENNSSNKTVIEIIEENSSVGFAIILHTTHPTLTQQNIFFEHGFLIGKIGRNKVCALVKEEIEKPKDISGISYIAIDESDLWCYSLAKELKTAGCYAIDMKKYISA